MCLYEDIEAQLRIGVKAVSAGEEDARYREFKCYEERGLEDALSSLHRLAGKGFNHAFICQALKQGYLRWIDSRPWSDPMMFKKVMAFSVGYYRLVHELEKMSSDRARA
jgi:hypothetical protein